MKEHCLDERISGKEPIILKPERPNLPVIRVMENREGRFTADFAIELAGVIVGGHRNGGRPDYEHDMEIRRQHYRNSMLSGLFNSHKVSFLYTAGIDSSGNTQFAWRVKGAADGGSPEQVVDRARTLWRNLHVIFGATEIDYRFEPVTNLLLLDTESTEKNWTGTIRPAGMTISTDTRSPLGFARGSEVSVSSVVLPIHPARNAVQHLDSVVIGATGCPAPVTIELSLSPFALTGDEKSLIGEVLASVRRGLSKSIKVEMKQKNDAEEDDEAIGKIENELEVWANNPAGLKVSCSVTSSEPIPLSYLSMVGGEIFKGAPVSIEMKAGSGSGGQSTVPEELLRHKILDLSNCINASYGIPVLFPHAKTLSRAGVKKVYACAAAETAESGIVLGYVDNGTEKRKIRFSNSDRSRHAYIVGATGTGKSTLLFNMMRQDIENGQGVCLIDPHGDLYNQVLDSIPKNRADEVVLINPCDFEHSVGINFLECGGKYKTVEMNFVANEMIKIFDRLYDLKQTGGPIFEQYMRNALLLLMDSEYKNATLMDVPLLFEDSDFRQFLKKKCKSALIRNFWTNQAEAAGGEASLRNVGPYITCKLNQFTTNAILRPIIGQPESTIDFREIMDSGKILLINLSKGLLGELDAQLLGMLIIGKIFSTAMGRVALTAEKRRPMYLYVDEFQNFTTDSVGHLLSEARKFGICLTLANQNLSQLQNSQGRQNILDSVLSNAGNTLIFRLGPIDSGKMESYVQPSFHAADLQELPDFHVAARLLTRNSPAKPFVLETMPKTAVSNPVSASALVTVSRAKYALPVKRIERDIEQRQTTYKDQF